MSRLFQTTPLISLSSALLAVSFAVGCSSDEPASQLGAGGSGGVSATGGGGASTGGIPNVGGSGGASGGGAPSAGGAASGGADGGDSTGGAAVGGAPATGGGPDSGGSTGGNSFDPWNGFVSDEAAARLQAEYDDWKGKYLKTDCPGGIYSVLKSSDEVVSESIGYGMLIVANLGSQEEFDGLLAFYEDALKTESGLMSWQCDGCGGDDCGGASATDGDLDVAMALLQAEQRWGGYASAALSVIQNLRGPLVVEECGTQTILKPGEWGGCSDTGAALINPSYFSPGYYRAFARVDPEGAELWNAMIESSYEIWDASKDAHLITNLLWPDGVEWNEEAMSFGGSNGFAGNGYDACRVPWRIAIDYAWTGEPRAEALLLYTGAAVDAEGFASLSTDQNSAFHGALALSGIGISQEKIDEYVATWMGATLADDIYFQATLRMIYLLVAAGQFPSTL